MSKVIHPKIRRFLPIVGAICCLAIFAAFAGNITVTALIVIAAGVSVISGFALGQTSKINWATDALQDIGDKRAAIEREACRLIAVRAGDPPDCPNSGFPCPETGHRECSLGDEWCVCAQMSITAGEIAEKIRGRG